MPRHDPLPGTYPQRSWLGRTLGRGWPGFTTPKKRKPREGGETIPAIPPRGPLPLQGGAEAPLEFRD